MTIFDDVKKRRCYYTMLGFLITSMCLQRIAMGVSSVCMGISAAFFLWMLYKEWDVVCKSWQNQELRKYAICFLIFVVCITPSFFGTDRFMVSLREYFNIVVYRILPLLIVVTFVKEKKILYGMLATYLVLEGIECGLAIWQTLTDFGGCNARGDGFGVKGLFIPGMLCYTIPLCLIICLDEKFSGKIKMLSCIVLPIFICAVFTNKSRMGFLVFMAVFFGILVLYSFKNKKVLLGMIASLLIVGLATVNSPQLTDRFRNGFDTTEANTNNYARMLLWKSSYNMMKDHPLTGVGLNNWKVAYKQKYKSQEIIRIGEGALSHAHSSYMQIGGEAGWPGFIGIIMFHLCVLQIALRDWIRGRSVYSAIIFFMWLGEALFGLVEPVFVQSCQIKNLMWMTGIVMSLKHVKVND